EAELAATGPLAIETAPHTGRSPDDKFIVREPASEGQIAWGKINHPFPPEAFDAFADRVTEYLCQRDRFILDLAACADPAYRLPVQIISESASHALFAHNLFIVPDREERMRNRAREGGFTILHAPSFKADPARDGTRSELAILLDFARRMVIITGTRYAGEIKKSIFSALQYLLPVQGVATMHCSCNEGPNGDSALFFGLSGTGKTTLSTAPDRTLIGDDEHGWADHGVFNFEGGSYAKVINLSPEAEPDIWDASHRFGTVLENVPLDPVTRQPLLEDDSVTENMRSAFPLSFIKNATTRGTTGHPSNILMLTADAFGVLPPVAKMTVDQGLYYYLSGYTSKLAGTETGINEPEATFSAGFGLPFMPLDPVRYAELLGERIRRHQPRLWLVNTGWIGGPYGTGRRIKLAYTRAIVRAILNGELDKASTHQEPFFGLAIPDACPDVPSDVLDPKATWQDKDAYDQSARRLAERFHRNFQQFADRTPKAVAGAGPRSV
ncbi:MAG TPA: phosphoenolpyruvate carboxykinase (ATP), partial [Thermomicrobiales bacterium]|nr:phosphoenolpyruvate carboxykinase (ATP) [Thermomicrobiales bacterium]